MKSSIFNLINWESNNKKINYLFVGNEHKKLIEKLKNKKINDKETEKLKEHFQNYSLLNNKIHEEDVEIIYESIYDDDTIYTLKNKISFYIKNFQINFDHIYVWNSKKLNDYELIDLLNNIFNNADDLNTSEITEILENVFNIKLTTTKKSFTINELYKELTNNKKKSINIPLELNYFDIKNNQKFIPSNPFKKIKLNEDFLDSDKNYKSDYKYKLDSFNIIKSKVDNFTINFTTTDDLFKSSKKKLNEDDDLIINGILKVYFPYIIDFDESTEYNDTYEDSIKNTDKIIRDFNLNQNKDMLNNEKSFVSRIHLKISPTSINIPLNNFLMNLEGYFNNFTTDEEIPMIVYKKTNNNIYKINKKSLGNKIEEDERKIYSRDLTKWTENTNIIRKNEFLEFKIFFQNFNDINITKYLILTIFDNGRFDVIYDFKINENGDLKNVIKSFEKVNRILNEINKKFNIKLINLNQNVFNTNVSFIDFVDFNMRNELDFNKAIPPDNDIKKLLELYYPYFDIVNTKNNAIYIKFKRINNFFNIGDVKNYIEENINKSKEELVPLIIKKFNINKTKAEKDFDEFKDLYNLNLTNNKITKSKINKGVFILLKITNKIQIKFLTKNLKNDTDNLLVIKLISFLTTQSKLLKDYNKKSKEVKLYKNFISDGQEFFTEKKESVSDDDFGYLSNSDDDIKSIKSIINNDDIGDNNSVNSLFEMNDDDLELLEMKDKDEDDKDEENLKNKTADDKDSNSEFDDDDDIKVKENELDINFDIDYSSLDDPKEKKKYDKLILKRLQKADIQLFKKPYTTKCQAVHRKQPVVITEKEKEYIDKKYPGSYTNFVKTGTTRSKKEQYYYICPKYWCPLSAVSLTNKQLKDNKDKCPKGEPPIVLSNKSWVKKDKDGKEYDVVKYPFLLEATLHDDGKSKMPCCRGKPPDAVVDEKKNKKYITKAKLPAKVGRFATLPDKLSKILGNNYPKDYAINNRTNVFVRQGIENDNQYALSSLIDVIDNKNIKNIGDFLNAIDNNMTKIDYFELNNGNTLKIYLNSDFNIYNQKTFNYFKENFKEDEKYLKKMNLLDLNKKIQKLDNFVYNDKDEYNNDILREFMIYNSFENFKLFLRSNLFKTHEEVLQLFANNYDWLNSKKHNIIVLDANNKKNKVEKIDILCSKFINYNHKINTDNEFAFIVKNENIYEPLVRIKSDVNASKTKSNTFHKSFEYGEDRRLKYIIDLQREHCNTNIMKGLINPIKLYEILNEKDNKLFIKAFVINMSFKFVGFLLKNNLFIPIDSNILSTNIFRDSDIKIENYIYIHNIIKFKCKLNIKNIKEILQNLNNKLGKKIYKVKETIEKDKKDVAIILENIVNDIIPLNISSDNKEDFINHIRDEIIFLGNENKNDTTSYINNYMDNVNEYEKKLKILINYIVSQIKVFKSIEMLKHKHNPFPQNIKIEKISKIIDDIIIKINKNKKNNLLELNQDEKNKLINDIYTKNLLYILRRTESELKLTKDEIVLNQDDIINNKLKELNEKLQNPYKNIENSIEDYIIYKGVKINIQKKDIKFKFLTNSFTNIPEWTWNDLLPSYEINLPDDDTKINNKDTKKFLLYTFSELSKIEGNKITKEILEKEINKKRKKDFEKDDEDKEEFIKKQSENIYFKTQFEKIDQDKIDVNDFEEYDQIFDENYKYSFYEIEKISEIIKISIIILGDFKNKFLTKGKRIYHEDNRKKFILLNMKTDNKFDTFNVIVKNTNKIIFEKNELPKKFLEYINELHPVP